MDNIDVYELPGEAFVAEPTRSIHPSHLHVEAGFCTRCGLRGESLKALCFPKTTTENF